VTRPAQTFAILAASALLAAGCAKSGNNGATDTDSGLESIPVQTSIDVPADAVTAAGDGKAKCADGTTIGYAGAMTGANAQLGINIYNGVQLAINQHNKANPGCQVEFKKFDTEGDPTKATGPVTQVVNDDSIIGVIGLPFSGESKATGKIFEDAGLVHITPSATNPDLTTNGWSTFFRGMGNDAVQGPTVAVLAKKLGAEKVYVVGDDSDYGIGLFKTSTEALGSMLVGKDKVTTGQKDFSATISKILNSKADAVFYSGYYAEGAPFDQQLAAKGFKGAFIGPDGVKDDEFVKQAGSASNNAYFTCPCIPGELIPDFADAYKKAFKNKAPGTYSIEGYDTAIVLLQGIDKGATTREKLLSFVQDYSGQGFAKSYKWADDGELTDTPVFGYKVDDGKIVSVGQLD
jgi:branched-chain amino acid transport system substrate-binding protein